MTPITLRLAEVRQKKGWSQAELARRAGIAASVVSRAERGETTLTLGNLDKLAKALSVNPKTLIRS